MPVVRLASDDPAWGNFEHGNCELEKMRLYTAKTIGRSAKAETSRNEILSAAANIMRRHGYAELTLRNVAAKVNMKAGSLYYHFSSKDELATEVMRIGVEAVERDVREALDQVSPIDSEQRLITAVHIHLNALLRSSEFVSSHIRCYPFVPDRVRFELREVRRRYDLLWLELIGEFINRPARGDEVIYIWHILVGALNQSLEWFNPNRHSIDDYARQIEIMLRQFRSQRPL
ncbi:TetR/AcrR family transcriptional regulator [Marinobacter sp. 71-i]|uniref:TetR/AcrR family transcriptional regulator n=1 Tax=Marinobacter iranensis TaxID=2962607 RepID=A0ABT5YCW5_9GAMM|nr:TetR/AcrR family transcriptional regulator [Marinobacter iranensis]MDF0750850.1 TetR/AcrR family transcriptional regulator [Marinobacter iranensis]